MKSYQDHDPVKDAGKALPHPKRPASYTYRGNRLGRPVSVSRETYDAKQAERRHSKAHKSGRPISIAALIAMLMPKRAARNR